MSRKARLTVAPPHFDTTNRIEYSIHKCPKTLYKEVLRIFPDQTLPEEEILIVSIFQPSGSDLVVSGDPQTEQTKDDLLQKFFIWGQAIVRYLKRKKYWADFIDPSSGYPYFGAKGGFCHNDLEVMQMLLPYETIQVGSCWVLEHPKWKTNVYPSLLYTTAPLSELQEAINEAFAGKVSRELLEKVYHNHHSGCSCHSLQ